MFSTVPHPLGSSAGSDLFGFLGIAHSECRIRSSQPDGKRTPAHTRRNAPFHYPCTSSSRRHGDSAVCDLVFINCPKGEIEHCCLHIRRAGLDIGPPDMPSVAMPVNPCKSNFSMDSCYVSHAHHRPRLTVVRLNPATPYVHHMVIHRTDHVHQRQGNLNRWVWRTKLGFPCRSPFRSPR